MIRLKRSRRAEDIHPDFTGEKLVAKALALAEARITMGDEIEFEKALGDWKKTKDQLKLDSHGKCAYCEANTAVVAHGDVEHFRPKSVYWWLALCLDNYVYSCQICNQTYKSDEFPVAGTMLAAPKLPKRLPKTVAARLRLAKRISPDPFGLDEAKLLAQWLAEDPDLPHPYLEDPEPLFGWCAIETTAEVLLVEPPQASPRSQRAVRAAIDYLGLNREVLVRLRYTVYRQLKFALLAWKTGDENLKVDGAAQVESMCAPPEMFAGMCRHFARRAGFPLL